METSLFILFFFLCLKSAQAKGSKYDGKKRTMKMEEMYKYKEKKRTKSEMSTQKGKKKKKPTKKWTTKKWTKTKRRKRKEAGWLGEGQFFPQYTSSPFSFAFSPQFGRLGFGGPREKIARPLQFSILLSS